MREGKRITERDGEGNRQERVNSETECKRRSDKEQARARETGLFCMAG